MKRNTTIALSLFTLIAGIILWWFSDTQILKRQTNQLAESLTISSTSKRTGRLLKVQSFQNLLDPEVRCAVDIAPYECDFQIDELITAFQAVAFSCDSTSARASDVVITFLDDDQATATADLSLILTRKNGTRHDEKCQATLLWKKNGQKEWKLHVIKLIR